MTALDLFLFLATTTAVSALFRVGKAARVLWGPAGLLLYALIALFLNVVTTAGLLAMLHVTHPHSILAVVFTCGVTTAALAAAVTTRPARLARRARPARRAGPRFSWFPYLTFGKAFTIAAGAVPLATIYFLLAGGLPESIAMRLHVLIVPLVVVASLFLDRAQRQLKAKTEANATKIKGAVVYIRGFREEWTRFAITSTDHKVNNKLGITYKTNRLRRGQATFAEFLALNVTRQLGPWRHMGNLKDRLPPHGGTPLYIANKQWRRDFAFLVRHSRCVITFPHHYPKLRYELSVIRNEGAHRRLFVLTPPLTSGRRMANIGSQRWYEFADTARQKHGSADPFSRELWPNPGPGAVVTFNDDGTALVLRTNAQTPADYVSAIKPHLDSLTSGPTAGSTPVSG
ncbi:hypothetical protein [Nocardia sp. NRRL S-836]|uniref:hypothetical protein n=1 Tax=Nocardia sp. NRRL S-836 TaxID=1519492 RepID=UPI0006ADD8C7|nr:hypothetical protein [Nocardia sp. NRRL S-836]KOV90089.1 hypothetical protein ADL03_01745 [Nocardia sp. NRRL S-836]